MGSKWSESSLLELYDVSSGLSKSAKFFGQGYPFVSFKDVFKNTFLPHQLDQLVLSEGKEQIKCSVKKGDVFITRTSETMHELGMSSVALKDYPEATFNGFSKRLRPKFETNKVLHPEYVGYYLRSPLFRQKMLSFSTMSTRASLNNEMIGRLTISYPDITEQKKISEILKKLDEKVELNQQTNQTLEQMAQALFKSWFVDFDPVIDNALATGNTIPDELQARTEARKKVFVERATNPKLKPLPEDIQQLFPNEFEHCGEMSIGLVGWIPKGWKTVAVSKAIHVNPKTILPKDTVAKFADMKTIPTSGYMVDEIIAKEYKGGAKFISKDVLLARITPCLQNGKTALVDFLSESEVGFGSTEFIVFRQKEKVTYPFIACLAREDSFRAHCMQSMVGSSGRQRVQNACFDDFHLVLPSMTEVLEQFTELTSLTFTKMTNSKLESQSLTKLRDTLLPKLISGELQLQE